jgi:translation initiation factor eIF-2B subunit delta
MLIFHYWFGKQVNKVFIGAYAMLANGTLMSRVGTAVVGMMAHASNVPLLVCCETYKFHERVQEDSMCFNELGDPEDLVQIDREDTRWGGILSDWRSVAKLKLLNLVCTFTLPTSFHS